LEYRATGLVGQSFTNQKLHFGMSSPWGEETGEGGRKNKSATAKYPKYENEFFLLRISRGSRFNLGWTTGGSGNKVGCVTGISGGEMRETGGEQSMEILCVKMSATDQRDHVSTIAKSNPMKALAQARDISEPWYRTQALSWVARFTNDDPVSVASEAAKAAKECG
jgi:hypothetical protein